MLVPRPWPLLLTLLLFLALVPGTFGTLREIGIGEFLASLFAEMQVDTMPALQWASVALQLGLPTVGDLLVAYERAVDQPASAAAGWHAFVAKSAMVGAGIPAAVVATVLALLVSKLLQIRSAAAATGAAQSSASTAEPPPKRSRAHPLRETRDEVLRETLFHTLPAAW